MCYNRQVQTKLQLLILVVSIAIYGHLSFSGRAGSAPTFKFVAEPSRYYVQEYREWMTTESLSSLAQARREVTNGCTKISRNNFKPDVAFEQQLLEVREKLEGIKKLCAIRAVPEQFRYAHLKFYEAAHEYSLALDALDHRAHSLGSESAQTYGELAYAHAKTGTRAYGRARALYRSR